ncbi:MAG: hypothetical protein M3Q08_01100 [Pseudomonadota bacterium]|nr:hypothetical protein [Pseudomonadota bacterium]
MAKLKIPGLTPKKTARGLRYYWQPSPSQRKAGWTALALGGDIEAAIGQARRRNEEIESWKLGGAKPRAVKQHVRRATMGALIDKFEEEHLPTLAATTQHEYRSCLRRIRTWTEDGKAPLGAITRLRVQTLKKALLKPDEHGRVKLHRAASILRVLRVLMQFGCDNDLIAENPVSKAHIPEPPPRAAITSGAAVAAIMDAALELDPPRPSVALGIVIGLNTMQRQGDILRLSELNWRELHNVPPEARPVLAGTDGRVMGFRLRQHKTGEWIEVPVAGAARASIELAIAENKATGGKVTALIKDEDEDRPYPQWKFQRQFRAAADLAREKAERAGDAELAAELADVQFRDLRRTGMCIYGELGVPIDMIVAISGHDIDRTKKILKTYMPRNSRMAAAAVAMAMQRLEARSAAEQERERQA